MLDYAPPSDASRFGLSIIGLLCLSTWALSHSYLGIFHDAGLYTLQALSHLQPISLNQDIFLKFGSQDRYTFFSPIYAGAAQLWGVEPGAAVLTLVSQLAFLGSAWAMARAVIPTPMALLGVAVLIAVPGCYGTNCIFTCIEPFLTPRMAAEALTLASLAAAMSSKHIAAASLILLAALIHPIMALAGSAALIYLYCAVPHPRLGVMLIIAALCTIATIAFFAPVGPWGRFDATWLNLVRNRTPYLFLSNWPVDDWARAALSLSTLTVSLVVLPHSRVRMLAGITLVSVLGGFTLTLIACDLLHLVFFTQLQPWRCQWLGTVTATLLLPETLRILWGQKLPGLSTAFLLIAAWIFASNTYALAAAVAALASLAFTHRLKATEARWIFRGAIGLCVIALAWRLASNLQFTEAHYFEPTIPLWIRRTMSFTRDGLAPAAMIAFTWWLSQRRYPFPALLAIGVLATAGCAALIPQTWQSWTAREYPSTRYAQLESFRNLIPLGADVFWPESPVADWVLLDRPSYLSVMQTSGMVFSRESALELNRRAQALSSAVSPGTFMDWSGAGNGMLFSRTQLELACKTGEFEYLVTNTPLQAKLLALISTSSPSVLPKSTRLYHCDKVRS